ncbi:STAS domain-containing protein [Streptomyces sp. NPDC100445]|uniref:STAS domain-containing protein n=1 Tax=Streptomyces sp. NPDC100445 TaxID=3366102 RepID=UPI003824CEE2
MAEAETTGTEQAGRTEQLSALTTVTEGIRVVTLAGEIDHATGETLRGALGSCDGSGSRVVADLSRVTFMDSSGINIFIAAHRALTEAGGWLRLAAPGESVMRTLSIVGVDAVIDCRDTLDHALGD